MIELGRPEIPFVEFGKIHRLNRDAVVSEKLDGTNAQVYIDETGERAFAGSRNRWLTTSDDNFGFARWVAEHHDELLALGPGSHYGEWWGAGIQRRYGLKEKRFSLFNVARWSDEGIAAYNAKIEGDTSKTPMAPRPACCHVVPVLARGALLDLDVRAIAESLKMGGSVAAPGFMQPEGLIVFHEPSRALYKYTLDHNDGHKTAKSP